MKSKVDFHLIMITDRKLCENLFQRIDKACSSGIKAVMIREKDLTDKELLKLSKQIKTITNKSKTKLIVNGDYDIAISLKAYGYHSPEKDTISGLIKNKKLLTGKSVHSVSSAKKAQELGFDYLLFGPVYRTPAKVKYGSPMGLRKLKEVCSSVKIPVFAVGGINPVRARKCIQSGAYGVAVIRELMLSDDIKKTVKEFKSMLRVNN